MSKKRKKSSKNRRRLSQRQPGNLTKVGDLLTNIEQLLGLERMLHEPQPQNRKEVHKVDKRIIEAEKRAARDYERYKREYRKQYPAAYYADEQKAVRRITDPEEIRRLEICLERRKRREAMFANKRAGKGIAGPREKRYTEKSNVRC